MEETNPRIVIRPRHTKLDPREKRLVGIMFILAIAGIIASFILPFVL